MNEQIVELNVGGIIYTTTTKTLLSEQDTYFSNQFNKTTSSFDSFKDSKGRWFIDRDGKLFEFILEFLRNKLVILPENYNEKHRLIFEAEFYKLKSMGCYIKSQIDTNNFEKLSVSPSSKHGSQNLTPGCIIIGYRGTFANGRDGLVDVKFRKVSRILVCGRVALCREAFGDTLNESRDPDHGVSDRYTCRYYLKHTFLEQAIDALLSTGFRLECAAATGANSGTILNEKDITNKLHLMNTDNEENKWLHYNEYVFIRDI